MDFSGNSSLKLRTDTKANMRLYQKGKRTSAMLNTEQKTEFSRGFSIITGYFRGFLVQFPIVRHRNLCKKLSFMAGLGYNIADIMEGIRHVEDLSKTKIVRRNRNYEHIANRLRWYYEGRSVKEHYI